MIDTLEAEAFGPLGAQPLCLIDLGAADGEARAREMRGMTHTVLLGMDRAGTLPPVDAALFDALLTTVQTPPSPWVEVPAGHWDDRIASIETIVTRAPIASSIAMHVLRIGEAMTFDDALYLESLAYSTLLGGWEFRRWLTGRGTMAAVPSSPAPFVSIAREGDHVELRLTRPAERNAICAGMRDALFEALAALLDDPSGPTLRLSGEGACFSTGGALGEFGTASDLAQAHAVRGTRACAALLHRLADRAEVLLHGACIGSGMEIAAAAARRIGRQGVFFQLPELTMGLLPGAGGTVTLTRAIGRHRTAAMLLTSRRINSATALDWGLLTGLEGA